MGTGKDVWEVIATVRDNDGGAYQDEIDQWIEMNDQEAAEARAAWMAGQAAVKR
jgi:hypothetical protein